MKNERERKLVPSERVRMLGIELNTDHKKLNNVSKLLLVLKSEPPLKSTEEQRRETISIGLNDSREQRKQKRESIIALERFFGQRLSRGDLELQKKTDDDFGVNAVGEDADASSRKRKAYRKWVRENYKIFTKRVIDVVVSKSSIVDDELRVFAFSSVMELARLGKTGDIDNDLFERALEKSLRSETFSEGLLGMLKKRYLGRVDVQYYVFKAVARISGRMVVRNNNSRNNQNTTTTDGAKKKKEENNGNADDNDDDDDDNDDDDRNNEATPEEVARNLYDVISNVSVDFEDYDGGRDYDDSNNYNAKKPLSSQEVDFAALLGLTKEDLEKGGMNDDDDEKKGNDEAQETMPWCRMPSQTVDADEQNTNAKRRKKESKGKALTTAKTNKVSWMDGVKRRRAFSDAWIAFLRIANFPEDVYRKILSKLHIDVIAHHVNPVLLCDFCIASVDIGGLVGMLALHALFVLVTKHDLEYPKFYDRLYNLINEDSFYANGRRTFFELADVFLKSPALPGYCAAAFCKKFARLSLSAPPAGAMLCVSFIHNLIRRHPKSCLPLIHRDQATLESEDQKVEHNGKNHENHRKTFDSDPYDFSATNPAKSRALESSLWEMTALEQHYFPQVTKLVQMLRMDLSDRVRTKEIVITGDGSDNNNNNSLCGANYFSLLREELDVRLKQVPALKHGTIGDLGLFHSDEFVNCANFGELIEWKEETFVE
jgi:hypothetical protein